MPMVMICIVVFSHNSNTRMIHVHLYMNYLISPNFVFKLAMYTYWSSTYSRDNVSTRLLISCPFSNTVVECAFGFLVGSNIFNLASSLVINIHG